MKPREFWIVGTIVGNYAQTTKPGADKDGYLIDPSSNYIHCREVLPEREAAIQKMVNILEKHLEVHYQLEHRGRGCASLTVFLDYDHFSILWDNAREALEAWRKANEP